MADPTQLVIEAGKKLGEVVATIGKHYLIALVTDAFVPALTDAINQTLDEAKESLGITEEETAADRLVWDKAEKQPDTFWVSVADARVFENPRFGPKFVVYDSYVVRIGHVDGKEGKEFYVNAQYFPVRYEQLVKVPDLIKKDQKEAKVPAFPARYVMGGTCCFCITKAPGDMNVHKQAMFSFFDGVFKGLPTSKCVADHFRVGDNWEIQQTAKQVFFNALLGVCDEMELEWAPDIDPFDEIEAIAELLKAYTVSKLMPTLEEPINALSVPPVAKNGLLNQVRSGVGGAIETAAKGWSPLQSVAAKAGEKATEKMKEGAEKVVEAIKPFIAKAVALVQEQMKKKAEEKKQEGKEVEEEKDTKAKIGDVVHKWKFQKTEIGKTLYDNLVKMPTVDAVKSTSDEITSKLRDAVRKPLDAIVEVLCGTVFVQDYWVQWQIWWMARKITNLICEITTLDGFLEAAQKLADAVQKHVNEEGGKCIGKKEELDKFVEGASAALWKALADQAVGLWTKIYKLSENINNLFSEQSEEVTEPLIELLSHIFEVQVRGFNAIRVTYTTKLKESIGEAKDHDALKAASSEAIRHAIFENVNILAEEFWVKTHEAIVEASKAYVRERFLKDIWPSIKSGLDDLLSLLPEELKSLGVDVAGMVLKVAIIIINKGVTWALTKIGMRMENAIFEQEE